ncbi:short transient receptor potential channel 5-like isoform X2 [Acanthaster planci]|uniref:Short transient receptor potential channel 5-like isoform X2 n=1 Tax=Acanthaster planci TaxID=133434 RepID=A0A8B7XH63_ACAPL|nr:short transient receptor potential channel 5-like isoform X2 [Acanthaster planci]
MMDQQLTEMQALLVANGQTGLPSAAGGEPALTGSMSLPHPDSESDYEEENARYEEMRGVIETGNGLKLGELLAEWQEMDWIRDWRNEENLTLYADAITDGYLDIINVLLSFDIPLGDALIRAIDVAFDDAITAICRYLEAHELLVNLGCKVTEPSMSQGGDVTLTQAISTLHIYRALSQPAYILATQTDIFGHAFHLSAKLKTLSRTWEDFGAEYEQMARGVDFFAGEMLGESSSTEEILALFRYHNTDKYRDLEGKQHPLAKLFEAIEYEQKEFIAHPHSQKAIIVQFYRNLLDWNERGILHQVLLILFVLLGFPIICLLYIFVPVRRVVNFARLPYVMMMMKAGSGFTFLIFIVAVTVMDKHAYPRTVELLHGFMLVWVIGLAWLHIKTIAKHGCSQYLADTVNLHELVIMALYFTVVILQWTGGSQVSDDPSRRYVRHEVGSQDISDVQYHVSSALENLQRRLNTSLLGGVNEILVKALSGCRPSPTDTIRSSLAMGVESSFENHLPELEETIGQGQFEPTIIAGALFGVTVTVSVLRLLNILLVSDSLGPLRISLGNMRGDIVKFCGIFLVIWFAFAIGLFQNFYSAGQSATRACIEQGQDSDSCQLLVGFSTFMASVQDLYWSLYGFIGTDVLQLPGKHSVAEGVGTFLFTGYLIVAVLVLLNALIGMLSNTYNLTEENADTEWKFHRAAVWASYLRPVATLPPPFNLIPSLKTVCGIYLCIVGLNREVVSRKDIHFKKELDDYERVLHLVSQRYIQANLSTESLNNENARPRDLQTLRNDILAFKFGVQERLKNLDNVLNITSGKTSTVHQKLEDLQPLDVRAEDLLDQSSHLTNVAVNLHDETDTLQQKQKIEISERDQDAEKMRTTIAQLRAEIADLISNHTAEHKRRNKLEADLNDSIHKLNDTVTGLQVEMERVEANHRDELCARDRKEEGLRDTILNIQDENKCLTDKVHTLNQEKANLERKVVEFNEDISALKLTPSTLTYTIVAHKTEIEKLNANHAAEMTAKIKQEAELNQTIRELQEENKHLQDGIGQAKNDNEGLERECSEMRDEVVALQFRIEEIIGNHKAEVRRKDQKHAKLEEVFRSLQNENVGLKDSVSELEANKEELTQRVHHLHEEVKGVQKENFVLKQALTRLQAETEQLKTRAVPGW